ncbi:LysM peptidoglycan-binding domain-containing protein [Aerococcaceae bacterium DSM 111022]|nr:LysM peptidoglycan-binding domain-containing protein [Aerococcaceae bacterium DSM 111022]
MPKEREDDFQTDEFEDLNNDNKPIDEINEEKNVDEEITSEDNTDKKPWHKRFGSDENLRNRQYSRTSRNQPKQEASTLSKVLLGAFVVLLIIPFVVLLIVESQRNNEEIPARTKEQVMISRSSISSESESSSESSASSEASSASQSQGNINVASGDESIGSQEIETSSVVQETTPVSEPVVEPTPTPEPEPAPSTSTTHTVSAGETWYGIARIHGINVYDLLAANGASEGTPIHPGDVVVVP